LPSDASQQRDRGSEAAKTPLLIFVDADACPVKEEVYKVARRHGCGVRVVSNSFMRTPADVQLVFVEAGPDVADDWIVEHVRPADIVITNDVPLAARTLKAGSMALGATGKPFTASSIGAALAHRDLSEHLRSIGQMTSGPGAFSQADRSRFLSALDTMVTKAKALRGV
jgi:uncharacterized protein